MTTTSNIPSFLILVFILVSSVTSCFAGKTASNDKGLFIVHFSWDRNSYPDNYTVTINVSKNTKIGKIASLQKETVKKNQPMTLEFSPGDYTISSIEFFSYDLMGKKIVIKTQLVFSITAGQVSDGGLIFLIKAPESNEVMIVQLDDHKGTEWYVSHYQKQFPVSSITPAWKYVEAEKIEKLKKDYAKSLATLEKSYKRKPAPYIYGALGILVRLGWDKDGVINGYRLIETNTYNEIIRATYGGDKILCDLGGGYVLYGTEKELAAIPLPETIESEPHFYLIGVDKILVFDDNINIFSSTGPVISWKKQDEYRTETPVMNPQFLKPRLSFGPDKMYLYTTGPNKFRNLWYASYDSMHFNRMEIPEDIKRISDVIPTKTKLVIGPVTNGLAKGGADIYTKENTSTQWEHSTGPRGDCDQLIIDKANENNVTINCGLTKLRQYTSTDGGKTWQEVDK